MPAPPESPLERQYRRARELARAALQDSDDKARKEGNDGRRGFDTSVHARRELFRRQRKGDWSEGVRELRDGTPYTPDDDLRSDPTRANLNRTTRSQVYHRLKRRDAPSIVRNPYALWKSSPWALEAYIFNQGLRAELFPKSNAPRTVKAALDLLFDDTARARATNNFRIRTLQRSINRGDADSIIPPGHGHFRPFDHVRRGILLAASHVRGNPDATERDVLRLHKEHRGGRGANVADRANSGWLNFGLLAYFRGIRPRPGSRFEAQHKRRGSRNTWHEQQPKSLRTEHVVNRKLVRERSVNEW